MAWWVCGTQRYCLCGIRSTCLYRVDNHIKIHTEWRCYNLIIAGGDKILCTVVYIYKQPLQFATIVKVQFSTVYSILLYEKKTLYIFLSSSEKIGSSLYRIANTVRAIELVKLLSIVHWYNKMALVVVDYKITTFVDQCIYQEKRRLFCRAFVWKTQKGYWASIVTKLIRTWDCHNGRIVTTVGIMNIGSRGDAFVVQGNDGQH